MNKKLKAAVKEAFEAPPPLRKKGFLQKTEKPHITMVSFILSQVTYIRKWVWGADICILTIALLNAAFQEQKLLFHLSALTPFLALTVLTENGRSQAHKMDEFEMSTRFSLKSVVLARLSILGTANFALLCFLLFVNQINKTLPVSKAAVYMLCPYLLTTFLGLWVSRLVRGKEFDFLCMGISAVLCCGNLMLPQLLPILYESSFFLWWVGLLFFFCIGVMREGHQMIIQTEELSWN